jgi:hypothetical protein
MYYITAIKHGHHHHYQTTSEYDAAILREVLERAGYQVAEPACGARPQYETPSSGASAA